MSREQVVPDALSAAPAQAVGEGWLPRWLAWWRRPAGGNAVGHLDEHLARDIGLPQDEVNRLRVDRLLSQGRDSEPWLW
ncbi:hypothetical protein [Achromobacter aloeverae]|uniref:DUF1127 domain-containing protein n=1 Tax=Achromobacter aloeverae TaxID=1750518 RepID=A0A4Q1HC78_9BURK|nr:hypothetical protein [Achromobacter aloeverae]RXN82720.1 hypothetical protein C7R54_28445 [Achromobacter aloeverae]